MSDVIEAVSTIRFDKDAVSDPSTKTTTVEWYRDPTGAFRCGLWSGEPGRAEIHYLKDEICTLLEGEVRLTDESGRTETFRAGDTFVVPTGFKGTWETVTPTRKFYAIHKPS